MIRVIVIAIGVLWCHPAAAGGHIRAFLETPAVTKEQMKRGPATQPAVGAASGRPASRKKPPARQKASVDRPAQQASTKHHVVPLVDNTGRQLVRSVGKQMVAAMRKLPAGSRVTLQTSHGRSRYRDYPLEALIMAGFSIAVLGEGQRPGDRGGGDRRRPDRRRGAKAEAAAPATVMTLLISGSARTDGKEAERLLGADLARELLRP